MAIRQSSGSPLRPQEQLTVRTADLPRSQAGSANTYAQEVTGTMSIDALSQPDLPFHLGSSVPLAGFDPQYGVENISIPHGYTVQAMHGGQAEVTSQPTVTSRIPPQPAISTYGVPSATWTMPIATASNAFDPAEIASDLPEDVAAQWQAYIAGA